MRKGREERRGDDRVEQERIKKRSERERKSALHMQFARMLVKAGKKKKAASHYKTAAELNSAVSAVCHFNLASLVQGDDDDAARTHYREAIRHNSNMAEAWHNLGALLLRSSEDDDAYACFLKALRIRGDAGYPEARFNVATVLRKLGRQREAVAFSWTCLLGDIVRAEKDRVKIDVSPPSPVDCGNAPLVGNEGVDLTVVCVKWGTKYGPEYVNRLYAGVRRHLRKRHRFVCLTDDASGLRTKDDDFEVRELPKGWQGWWNKATLFDPATGLRGRVIYIDLDTVIVGSLDPIASFSGLFATLGTDNFRNERRKDGLNSSVMIFNPYKGAVVVDEKKDGSGRSTNDIVQIYERLVHFSSQIVGRTVHRFDHWLEMNLSRVPRLQALYPNLFVEYANDCSGGRSLPPGAAVVNFPLRPKPHEVKDPWISMHWVVDESDEGHGVGGS